VTAIETAGGRAWAVEADLTDDDTPARLFDEAEARFGPVDILINNASGWVADSFVAKDADRIGRELPPLSASTFDRVMAVDGRASALLIAEFARRHRERGATWGRIVGLTSGGADGFPEETSYGAGKAALESLTMTAALELARFGVTANTVHPPVTDTGWVTDEVRELVQNAEDMFHIASPAEVAVTVRYLCTDEASLITANRIVLR
jgi:3-oxoacyl-[acyl-carrier protein] reductase